MHRKGVSSASGSSCSCVHSGVRRVCGAEDVLIAAPEGPFRLIVLGEGRPSRSARQAASISVVRP